MRGRLRIRTRIALGSLLIALLLAVPSGILLDVQLRHIVRLGTADVLKSDQEPYAVDVRDGRTSGFEAPGPSAHLAVIAPDGTREVDTLPRAVRKDLDDVLQDDETRAVPVAGRVYLVRSEPVEGSGGTWFVVASRDGSSEEATLGPMRILLVAVLAAVVIGVAVGAWLLAAVSLRPVSRLRETASRLSTSGGDELLPVGRIDDEISRLATTLNALVSGLREAADRERRLVSDASHELRTPVAVVRTQLELARSGSGDAEALRRDIAEAEAGVVRLGRLLDSLLELSAIQAGAHAASSRVTELDDEVRDAVDRAAFRSGRATIRVETDAATGAGSVRIATEDVGRIVDNLLNNALTALDGRAGTILVSLAVDAETVRIAVADDAGGLDPEVAGTLALRRFTRAPRSRRGTGAGLGLPIVAALVDAAGGELRLDDRPGTGLTVALVLPVVPDA